MEEINLIYNNIIHELQTKTEADDFYNYLNSYYNNLIQHKEKSLISENMIQHFINNNSIYYCKTSKIYFNCQNNNIIACNEDNMFYYILDYITNNKNNYTFDITLKNITKNKIIKKIKENYNVLEIIPESETIQYIINCLYPIIFKDKTMTKLWLILFGDIILKKINTNTIFFCKTSIKSLLNDINKYICIYFGNNNIFNYIKFKYTTDHDTYEKYILDSNDINYDIFNFKQQFFINLLCVSIYYSNRYTNINNYIENEVNEDNNIISLFKNTSKKDIINNYINTFLLVDDTQIIYEKELIYLWKKYINENNLFINVFTSYNDFIISLFEHLNKEYNSTNTNNKLNGFYCLETPNIECFKTFWNDNFYFDENEYYFEINEILYLFNKYCTNKYKALTEKSIINILQIYYSQFVISNKKHIHNLKCNLWDKKKEIDNFINKENIILKNTNINELYKIYNQKNKTNIKISKKYFNMYLDTIINV